MDGSFFKLTKNGDRMVIIKKEKFTSEKSVLYVKNKQTEEKKQFFYNFARSISDAEQQHSADYGCRDHHRMHADHGKSDSQCIVQKLYGRMITFIPIHFASPSPADSFSVSCFSESVLFPFFLFF